MAPRHALSRRDVVKIAVAIVEEYKQYGIRMTLRQLYYQFVARGYVPRGGKPGTGQKIYKRIGAILTEARYKGHFPIDALIDRGRDVYAADFLRNDVVVDDRINQNALGLASAIPDSILRAGRWQGQETHVSVWVEKEGLTGVFEDPCTQLGVSWYAVRGYSSVSGIRDWLNDTRLCIAPSDGPVEWIDKRSNQMMRATAKRAKVFYFGDLDPDGIEISRAAERGLHKLQLLHLKMSYPKIDWKKYNDDAWLDALRDPEWRESVRDTIDQREFFDIEFIRIALNMDQVQKYDPPPMDAKKTSSRYKAYKEEFGIDDAWELDALNPKVLRDLIYESVAPHFDEAIHEANKKTVAEQREAFLDRITCNADWVRSAYKLDPLPPKIEPEAHKTAIIQSFVEGYEDGTNNGQLRIDRRVPTTSAWVTSDASKIFNAVSKDDSNG